MEILRERTWRHPSMNSCGESYENSRNFCGHVNFPEMNGGISVYGGTKSKNDKEGGLVIANNTLQK